MTTVLWYWVRIKVYSLISLWKNEASFSSEMILMLNAVNLKKIQLSLTCQISSQYQYSGLECLFLADFPAIIFSSIANIHSYVFMNPKVQTCIHKSFLLLPILFVVRCIVRSYAFFVNPKVHTCTHVHTHAHTHATLISLEQSLQCSAYMHKWTTQVKGQTAHTSDNATWQHMWQCYIAMLHDNSHDNATWQLTWQWYVTMVHDNATWQLTWQCYVTMLGDNTMWQCYVTMLRDNATHMFSVNCGFGTLAMLWQG